MNASQLFRAIQALSVLAAVICLGCSSSGPTRRDAPQAADDVDLRSEIDRLYEAFCFDADGEADWSVLRSMFAEGATFSSPAADGQDHAGVDGETFIAEFKRFINGSSLGEKGYHERVVHVSGDHFGRIAHTWVTFDGFVPGEAPDRRGVDSIQWVLDDGWKVMSFATQYASDDLPLPRRFIQRRRY
ncbi:MAG: hypothetical protein AAGG01_01110 [Planctomycetota bacterium]